MKLNIFFFTSLLAITTTVLANPIGGEHPHRHFCYRPGESCSKARRNLGHLAIIHKRTALALANANPSPQAVEAESEHRHFCYRPGEPCSKLKRAASAAASAMALDIDFLPEPASEKIHHHFCYRPGESCSKARRDALALAESLPLSLPLPAPKALVGRGWKWGDGEPGPKHHFCYRPGESCSKAKRDVLDAEETEAEVFAQAQKRDVDVKAERVQAQEYCDSEAGPCAALRRFVGEVAGAVADNPNTTAIVGEEEMEVRKRCYAAGGECAEYSRAVEEVREIVERF